MSKHRYFWASQYHWGIPNPEVNLIIQQRGYISANQTEWRTLYISIRSVSKIISRYYRETIRIRCRIWLSESHPAANNGHFIGYHTLTCEEEESQAYNHLIRRLIESIEQAHFWLDAISSPWSGNHTPTPEPHIPVTVEIIEPTPPTPPEES